MATLKAHTKESVTMYSIYALALVKTITGGSISTTGAFVVHHPLPRLPSFI
jgi:hypothetical protein